MEDDDDEEMREWEMAQVKRAGGWQSEEQEKPAKPSYQPTPSEHHFAGHADMGFYLT